MKLPPSNITSDQLEEWFEASGCVKRLFYPPKVPSPPLKLEELEQTMQDNKEKDSHE